MSFAFLDPDPIPIGIRNTSSYQPLFSSRFIIGIRLGLLTLFMFQSLSTTAFLARAIANDQIDQGYWRVRDYWDFRGLSEKRTSNAELGGGGGGDAPRIAF